MKNLDWSWLIPVAVPLLIALLKTWVPKIPKAVLPILAPLLGVALEAIKQAMLDGPDHTMLEAGTMGAAGVGVREIMDQAKRSGGEAAKTVGLLAAMLGLCSGCSTYTHERTLVDGSKESTRFLSVLMLGKASNIKATTTDGNYKRAVGVGSVEGQTETEKLGGLAEAIAAGVAKGMK